MKAIHSVILVTLVVLISSCCHEKKEGSVKLTEVQKQWIPYKKGDTVNFSGQGGKTVNCKVTEDKQTWSHVDIFTESMCTDYFLFENRSIVLASVSDDLKITLRMSLNHDCEDENGNYDGFSRWDGSCSIRIGMNMVYRYGKDYLYCSLLHLDKDGFVSSDKIHESLEINNQIYHNVIETNQTIGNDQKSPVQLFYNKDYGILQIKVDNQNFLMLNR